MFFNTSGWLKWMFSFDYTVVLRLKRDWHVHNYVCVYFQCMDFGFHNSIRGTVLIYQTAHCNMRNSHMTAIEQLNDVISRMDPQTDKQKFLEIYNQAFMLPKKFEFQSCRGDEVKLVPIFVIKI